MVSYLLICVVLLVIGGKVLSISSPGPLTKEVGQDVVFMVNGTEMSEATWGVRDGDTKDLKPRLIKVLNPGGVFPYSDSTGYAGRVSYVGDLSKGQAWFKITNLNFSDTNQYMAKILQGQSSYRYIATRLTVIQPVPTTVSTTVPTTASLSATSLSPTSLITQGPTNLPSINPPSLKNLTTSLKVKREFSKNMEESNSSSFLAFAKEFKTVIKLAYTGESNFDNVRVISLSKGSILVTFIVIFKSKISYAKACTYLEKAIQNDKLGKFEIVPGSLRCSKAKPSSPLPPDASTGVHPGIIAGVAVVGVLAIAGLIITMIFVCRKKASKKDYRSSTGPGQGHEMEARHGEPEEQYASVQRPNASGAKQSPENDQPLSQYAAVDKSKKTKKKTKEPGELIYAQLDHDYNASMGTKPPSDRRSTGETGDTVYADIQGDKKKQRYPPPQYGNIHDMSYA